MRVYAKAVTPNVLIGGLARGHAGGPSSSPGFPIEACLRACPRPSRRAVTHRQAFGNDGLSEVRENRDGKP